MHLYLTRGVYPKPYLASTYRKHLEANIIADDDLLTDYAGQYKHGLHPSLGGVPSLPGNAQRFNAEQGFEAVQG